ncbi:hypothetical protein Q5P01_000027 [Channa striata]|uniref:Reverse transcriptase n=1 Tax=Channa striata TaxID=64152 RepID=A0AA88LJ89_CHASR|nr:hypothetical protein Q5P01_000027 [Channa striata]
MSADIMEANKREECGTRGFRVPSTSAVNGGVTGSGEKSVVERAMDDRGRSGEREGERSGAMVEQGPATARAGGDGRNETERAGETGRRGGERRQQDVKKYEKDLTVMAEILGEERLKTMEVMRAMRDICGDPDIQGIRTPRGNEFRIAQYADDINIMVRDCASLRRLILGPGTDLGEEDWGYRRFTGEVKVLGIYMGHNSMECYKKTWEERLAWCRTRMALWKLRQIGLKGKVTIINSTIVPMLMYAMQVCPIATEVWSSLCSMVEDFLWNSRAVVVAHRTLIGPVEKGGLNLCDLQIKMIALRIKLFKKALNNELGNIWADYMIEDIKKRGNYGLFNLCSYSFAKNVPGSDPLFQEAAEAWSKIVSQLNVVTKGKTDVLNQPLYDNPCLGGKKVLREGTGLVFKVIKQIKDIVDNRGHISIKTTLEKLRIYGTLINRRQVINIIKM